MLVVAAGCALAGVANAIEDGLGMKGFGTLYVLGAIVGGFGLLVVAAMLWPSPARHLTFVPAVGALAMMAVTTGGGVLALVALGRVRRDPDPRTAAAGADRVRLTRLPTPGSRRLSRPRPPARPRRAGARTRA